MKRLLIFFMIAFISPEASFAQLQLEDKKGKTTSYLFSKNYEELMFVTKERGVVKIYYLNDDYTQKSITHIESETSLIDYEIADITELNGEDVVILSDGYGKFKQLFKPSGKEQFMLRSLSLYKPVDAKKIADIKWGNKFCKISIDKKNEVTISSTDLINPEINIYKLDSDYKLAKVFKNRSGADRGSSIIPSMNNNVFSDTNADAKIYIDDYLYITFEAVEGTYIYQFDLEKDEVKDYFVEYNNSYTVSNSLLDEKTLWQLGSKGFKMELKATQIETGEELFRHVFDEAESIEKVSSEFIQMGSTFNGANAQKIYEEYDEFRKNSSFRNVALAKNKIGDKYVLQLGHFDEVASGATYVGLVAGVGLGIASNGFVRVSGSGTVGKEFYFMTAFDINKNGTFELVKDDEISNKNLAINNAIAFLNGKNSSTIIRGGLENPFGDHKVVVFHGTNSRLINFKVFDKYSEPLP